MGQDSQDLSLAEAQQSLDKGSSQAFNAFSRLICSKQRFLQVMQTT